jgi:hypothetical protein
MKIEFKKIILLVLFISYTNMYTQEKIAGKVLDRSTNTPLSYVNIGVFSKDLGTVSNGAGDFNLKIENENLKDSITFSMIGFKTRKIPVAYFNLKDTIYLDEEGIELEEIFISNKKGKSKILGNKKPKLFFASISFKKIEAGNELGIKIKVKKNTDVNKFNLLLVKNDYPNLKLRLNFYNLKDNKPYERINSENIIFETSIEKGVLSIDLTDYNITLNEDFFVSIESLNKLDDENKQIIVAGRVLGKSYGRKTSQGSWTKIKIGFCLSLDVLQY